MPPLRQPRRLAPPQRRAAPHHAAVPAANRPAAPQIPRPQAPARRTRRRLGPSRGKGGRRGSTLRRSRSLRQPPHSARAPRSRPPLPVIRPRLPAARPSGARLQRRGQTWPSGSTAACVPCRRGELSRSRSPPLHSARPCPATHRSTSGQNITSGYCLLSVRPGLTGNVQEADV